MNIAGIISEYNPFHNGHLYQIEKTKELFGATHIISVMSGNFVQRGGPAYFSKRARAKAALLCGADLVIELPLPWAISGAATFAKGGVELLDSCGCCDLISFGSECENTDLLFECAAALRTEKFKRELKKHLSKRISFASARELALKTIIGEKSAKVVETPNNILAIEYIGAIMDLKSDIKAVSVKRKGTHHDSDKPTENIASASFIRKSGQLAPFVPKPALEIFESEIKNGFAPANLKIMERGFVLKLRSMSPDDFKKLPDISEGLHNRIYNAVKEYNTLDEIISHVKTKRYSHARIRRIILSALLDITADDTLFSIPYIRILGFNEKGADILNKMKQNAKIPIYTRTSELLENGGWLYKKEIFASEVYNLLLPEPQKARSEMTQSIITPLMLK